MSKSAWQVPPPVFLHLTDAGHESLLKFIEEKIPQPLETYSGKKVLVLHPEGKSPDDIRRLLSKYGCQELVCCYPERLPDDLRARHVLPNEKGRIHLQTFAGRNRLAFIFPCAWHDNGHCQCIVSAYLPLGDRHVQYPR